MSRAPAPPPPPSSMSRGAFRHDLKTWPSAFEAVWSGVKQYELRNDDRNYKVRDRLLLREWDPAQRAYLGRWVEVEVTYITRHGDFPGLQFGFVILGISKRVQSSDDRPSEKD